MNITNEMYGYIYYIASVLVIVITTLLVYFRKSNLTYYKAIKKDVCASISPEYDKKKFNVPFQRNPFFTGREGVLQRIHDDFTKQGIAAISQAVAGMGGIGKTQTAVEYAYRYGNEYDAVFWISAEKAEDIDSGFVQIATLLGLPEADCPDSQVAVGAAMQWLAENGKWLLVFDNADEPTLLEGYMNPAYQGHILITSRADRFDMLNIAAPARLEVLPPDDALAFLLKRAECKNPGEAQINAARAVAERLGSSPLALEQAGAFVLARRCSFTDYLAEYEKKGVALLGEQGPIAGDYHKTVLTTWAVNFAQVEKKSPASAELLRVCAFLAPESIPYRLVMESAEHFGPAVQAALGDEPTNLSVANLLAPLADFSLVGLNPGAHIFYLHRLVQEAVKHGLGEENEREYAGRAVRAVNAVFPNTKPENWPWCEVLLAHALTCDSHIAGLGIATEEAGRLLNQVAYYAGERARYPLAEQLCQRSLAISEKVFGPKHPFSATNLNNLAGLYEATGRLSDAEPLYQRVVNIFEEVLGSEHPSTATSLNNLAELYRTTGRLSDAEPLLRRALAIREQVLGSEHPDTGVSYGNLAGVDEALGKYVEAEPLRRKAVEVHEKALGPDHPYVAIGLNNLAGLYHATGRLAEAEPLYARSLAICEKVLGSEHPDTATSLNNLAGLYYATGRFSDAEPLYARSLAIREKVLGPEHPDTATSLNNLAGLYRATGRLADAEPLYARSLAILEKVLGPEHPDTGGSCYNLGTLLLELDRPDEARLYFERAAAVKAKHPYVGYKVPDLGEGAVGAAPDDPSPVPGA